ncbi:MAG: PEP/pyruvate-binding domain-containing protein [Candidatus Omnitrophota bacterium]|nr:PEP/pyruvate-binding domain-containing protein [Candidatus Omnitrophota bacterium]MBU2035131.1 PEP/pyruvate-binding domain-containing protein [Candidatus Omnitrophota bacterium]MBU2221888.1 PEP/pyruvate-binding domain-containing protein [Candidatus Omnitrophota bacterium]
MVSTGLKGLDKVINSLRLGDNVVWQIDSIDDYADFVRPFVKSALEEKRRLVYIRFAHHKPLLPDKKEITVYKLDAFSGFESFSTQLNSIITKEGKEVFYVFDCLSDLLSAWSNDLMIGNFFKITCPYLFELDTIAYFSLLRNSHSFKTVARIREITQLLVNVYNFEGNYYVHPLKVWNRYSPTMFLPHLKKQERFVPIGNSVDTARLFSNIIKKGAKSTKRNLDYWDRLFLKVEDLTGQSGTAEEKSKMLEHLCRMIIARDEKFFRLAKENLSLEDFLAIKTRMVGTGFIGGKSVGMLIARSILLKEKDLKAEEFFEPHDSFYIGSDVFYTYIVENGWWKARMDQRTKDGYFKVANILKEQMLSGVFPEEIKEQFKQMIDYFGQSPIIVRSSSLLEDSFGNAFAGKYESIFLVNQGTPDERYARFSEAVRRIYASTMNEDALAYRLQRGLDQQDEQMALLVQRVSGAYHKDYFFPDAAGVGISYNTFVWKKDLDPEAGMLRIVLGLGTRAVNRVEGDYPRIVALDQPLLKAHSGLEDAQKFSQHDIDLLNIRENKLQTRTLRELLNEKVEIKLDLLAVRDYEASERMRQMGKDEESWIINFDTLFTKTDFRETLQKILKILQAHYGYPVDIEFTVNFDKHDKFKINLLQCRTIQGRGLGKRVEIPEKIEKERILFESQGNFLGGNFSHLIRRVIYVDPQGYSQLPVTGKYDIARAVGELNRQIKDKEEFPVILLGPGRWGTTTPSLGVPVSFAEINNISVLAEVSFASANCIPELSFGTHFFQDLIETGIFYVALFVDNKEAFLNTEMIGSWPNSLTKFAQSYAKYSPVIKVYDLDKKELRIVSDIISQKVVCFH